MSARPPRRSARTSFLGGRALVQQAGEPVACGLLPEAERPLQAELHSLERFAALMASEGWAAHVAAMAFDRIYARERFIFARRHGSPELASLAMHLLYCHRYGRAGWIPPA